MTDSITIDGSLGEGGGQVLRTSLALSMITQTPLIIERIRAGRAKPGLMRQHLTCVQAAQAICQGVARGAQLGSTQLIFEPGPIQPGQYSFAVGTAGSTSLVLQTVLPALMLADEPSTVRCKGGTHNPQAPTFEFLEQAYAPLLGRIGPGLALSLVSHGFYPAGGGELLAQISPCAKDQLQALELHERGELRAQQAVATASSLPEGVLTRELAELKRLLRWPDASLSRALARSPGPGNVITLTISFKALTEVFVAFGAKGTTSEQVAQTVVQEYHDYLGALAPVGEHLTDQLTLPMALAGRGSIRCSPPSRHTRTNIEVIEKFLEVEFTLERVEGRMWQLDVAS